MHGEEYKMHGMNPSNPYLKMKKEDSSERKKKKSNFINI
jgi:hypothetical protein